MRDLIKIWAVVICIAAAGAILSAMTGCRGGYGGQSGGSAYYGGNPGMQGYYFSAPSDARITTHLTPGGTSWEYTY